MYLILRRLKLWFRARRLQTKVLHTELYHCDQNASLPGNLTMTKPRIFTLFTRRTTFSPFPGRFLKRIIPPNLWPF